MQRTQQPVSNKTLQGTPTLAQREQGVGIKCEDSEKDREDRFSRQTQAFAEETERGTLGIVREKQLSMRRTPPTYTQGRRDDSWRRREVMSRIRSLAGG